MLLISVLGQNKYFSIGENKNSLIIALIPQSHPLQ